MKLALGSDLHLEFSKLDAAENREAAEVLILSGANIGLKVFMDARRPVTP